MSFSLLRPSRAAIDAFLDAERRGSITYEGRGLSRTDQAPPGHVTNAISGPIGAGQADWHAARQALARWTMFDLGWASICWPDAPLTEGTTVAVLARRFGLWSLNACTIVYTFDEPNGDDRITRFGFGYGTLSGHLFQGEERFEVFWNHDDDTVHFALFAFARPNSLFARLALPILRHAQRHFARDALASMRRAVAHRSADPLTHAQEAPTT